VKHLHDCQQLSTHLDCKGVPAFGENDGKDFILLAKRQHQMIANSFHHLNRASEATVLLVPSQNAACKCKCKDLMGFSWKLCNDAGWRLTQIHIFGRSRQDT